MNIIFVNSVVTFSNLSSKNIDILSYSNEFCQHLFQSSFFQKLGQNPLCKAIYNANTVISITFSYTATYQTTDIVQFNENVLKMESCGDSYINTISFGTFTNNIAGSVPQPDFDFKTPKYLSLCDDNIISVENIVNDGFHAL